MNPKPPKPAEHTVRLSTKGQLVLPKEIRAKPVYLDLLVLATLPTTAIWLGDVVGHLVQKEVGELKTSLLPGNYVVEFELGTPTYPIRLAKASRSTQAELEAGQPCPRPNPQLDD